MSLQSTDPEYTQRLGAFLEEVRNEPDSMLEPTTRWLAILATLTGNGSVDAYKEALPQALQEGLDPVAVSVPGHRLPRLRPCAAVSTRHQRRADRRRHCPTTTRPGNHHHE